MITIFGLPLSVEVEHRPAGVPDAVETKPAQLTRTIDRHRPRARAVVGEVRLRAAVVVEVESRVIGDPIGGEVGHRVIEQVRAKA